MRSLAELANLEKQSQTLGAAWNAIKAKTAEVVSLQQAIEDARHALDVAQREGNLEAAAELTYGKLPALAQDLAAAKAAVAESELLNEEVTSQHIASVISNWTGIPVDKMLEGERDKLLAMEGLHWQTDHWAGRCGQGGCQCHKTCARWPC
jgi:ATP-dependent Clp protease ATP-binding subunit ClpB